MLRRNYPNCVLTILIALICCGLSSPSATGEIADLWGNLQPGATYGVGFTTIEKYDYSRTIRSGQDYFGNPIPGETARPIQVCIWYPTKPTDEQAMVFGEYVFPFPSDSRFMNFLTQVQNRELGRLQQVTSDDPGLLSDIQDFELYAVRDVTPVADAVFPLVLYVPSLMGGIVENVVLCEYLASHGFVVATTHSWGTRTANPAATLADLDTRVRDFETVLAMMRDFPCADLSRLGIVGNDFGGAATLILAMKNTNADAAVFLGNGLLESGYAELVRSSAHFSTRAVTLKLRMVRLVRKMRP